MAKMTQGKMTETPQAAKDGLATTAFGGEAPTKHDIIKSANARAQKRHEMKSEQLADENTLPQSAKMMGNEMVGVKDNGYLVKKGLDYGVNAFYNSLPPGTDIEDQENADIRKMDMYNYSGGLSYDGESKGK